MCSSDLGNRRMPNSFVSGSIVSVPCEIRPGMASVESEIRIRVPDGPILAFVDRSSILKDPAPDSRKVREGIVKAVVILFSEDDVRLLFAGQDVQPSNPARVPPAWLEKHATLVS